MLPNVVAAEAKSKPEPESLVKLLYDSFTPEQRKTLCFEWDYVHPERGLLRTRIENNWNITELMINEDFSKDQRDMIRGIYEGILHPDWHAKIDQQLKDDAGGWGIDQSIAIFGDPSSDKFEFVMTGRHMTMRCDGNTAEHVAFGGPIFYGHAASDFYEPADHPGNVFWYQAVEANKVYEMLDGKQRQQALVDKRPREQAAGFQGDGGRFAGLRVSEMSPDQQEQVEQVLKSLLEPYRNTDRAEVKQCVKAQGGLRECSLAFYKDGDIGDDKVWDNWRLEGPSFVWYFRGEPHVHVWVNIADDPSVKLNS